MTRRKLTPEQQAKQRALVESLARLEAQRYAAGVCRHCGGTIPCWSEFGDVAVGVRRYERKGWKLKT